MHYDLNPTAHSSWSRTGGAGDGGWRRRGQSAAELAIEEATKVEGCLAVIAVARGCSTCSRWSKGRTRLIGIPRRRCAAPRARLLVDGGEPMVHSKPNKPCS